MSKDRYSSGRRAVVLRYLVLQAQVRFYTWHNRHLQAEIDRHRRYLGLDEIPGQQRLRL